MDATKRCSICKTELPATAEYFTRDRGNKDGLRSQCKACYRAKQRGWRQADKPRYSGYAHEHYLRNSEAIKEKVKAYQQGDKAKLYRRAYALRNVQAKRQTDRQYYQKQRDRILGRALKWQRDNPRRRQVIRQRRAARIAALPVNFTEQDWQFALDYFEGRCAACGRPAGLWHTLAADHWIALANDHCPGTIPDNIVPLCHGDGGCNNAKQDREPLEWLESQFGIKQAQAVNKRIHSFFSVTRYVK
jgi:hypothetical protein